MRVTTALVALFLSNAGCMRPAPPAGMETIVVDAGMVSAVCAGHCPEYRLTATSSGDVELVGTRPSEDGSVPSGRWRISPEAFRAFRAALAPVRPDGFRRDGRRARDPDLSSGRPYYFEIDWREPGRHSHLSAQVGSRIVRAVDRAVCAVGVEPVLSEKLELGDPSWCGAGEGETE